MNKNSKCTTRHELTETVTYEEQYLTDKLEPYSTNIHKIQNLTIETMH